MTTRTRHVRSLERKTRNVECMTEPREENLSQRSVICISYKLRKTTGKKKKIQHQSGLTERVQMSL